MSQKKKLFFSSQRGVASVFAIVGVLILSLALVAATRLVQERQEIRKGAIYPYPGEIYPYPTAIPTPQCPANGDFNGDGKVDEFDYGIIIAHFGEEGIPGEVMGDANCDGRVDEFDYGIIIAHFGEGE